MSSIPTQFPVTLTDGERDYSVFNSTEFVNAVYKHGHHLVEDPAAQAEPADAADQVDEAPAAAE